MALYVRTEANIKHTGHRIPATPLAPPALSALGSIDVNILGMRHMNNETNIIIAHRNCRRVGTL